MNENKDNTLAVTPEGELEGLPVSMQIYQAIYNQLTGRSEKITDSYGCYYILTLDGLLNLKHCLDQFSEQYHIKGMNSSITIFHMKGSKERFSSFERLHTYNTKNSNPIERIHIEVNFLIIPPKINTPQAYKITVTLRAGLIFLEKAANFSLPKELMLSAIVRILQKETAEIEIEYIDYMVARGISELFRDWIKSMPEVKPSSAIGLWQSRSYLVRKFFQISFFFLSVYFSVVYTDKYLSINNSNISILAKYLIFTFSSMLTIYHIGNFLGRRVEKSIDSINANAYSIIDINSGDKKLRGQYKENKKQSIIKFIKEISVAFIVRVFSSLAASYLLK